MTNAFRIALLSFAATALASAATYRLNLPLDATLGGQELKAGDYKVDVNGDTAVIKSGKQSVEAKVTTETAEKKYDSTAVKYTQADGKYTLQSISDWRQEFEAGFRRAEGGKRRLVITSADPVFEPGPAFLL